MQLVNCQISKNIVVYGLRTLNLFSSEAKRYVALFSNDQNFKFKLLKLVTAPNFPFMSKLQCPSVPDHLSAYRMVGFQLFHSCQIY
jgi:hypothetical protein